MSAASNLGPLNYDPADPDKMRLPQGKTCGDCVHIRRCSMIFGHTETDSYCDWSPSRFQPAPKAQQGGSSLTAQQLIDSHRTGDHALASDASL